MARRHPILKGFLYLAALGFVLIVFAAVYGRLKEDGVGFLERNAVAIVLVDGVIEESRDTVRTLDRLAANDAVRAVVVRVDSPGGGVAPSQEIYDAIRRVRKKKPIAASLGSVAASGGYYIASACDPIVANPGTMTGSIGVIMEMGNVSELMKKVGLQGFVLKAGKFKDIGSPLREMTDEERRLLEGVLENVHAQFIAAIAEGRQLPVADVQKLADGRVYSGQQALALHLVDKLGGLSEAVHAAAERAGIAGEPHWVEIEPRRRSWLWERLTSLLQAAPKGFGGLQFLYTGPIAAG